MAGKLNKRPGALRPRPGGHLSGWQAPACLGPRGFHPTGHIGAANTVIDKVEIDQLLVEVLRDLVKNDTRVAADPHAKNGFATLARKPRKAQHLTWQMVCSAQERLLEAGKIAKVEMGPARTRLRAYLRTPDVLYPGEARERKS